MTSILGLFHRDGSGQAPLASPAIAALAARGPLEVAQEPAVILAGSQLDRIRDDFSEHRLIVALDGRIDNRGELEERLGLRDMARMSMAELIGHLYLKYKNLCPSFILGDFSFLVFDTRDHSVFGARDQFGVRPFYYYAAHDRFVAASTIGALLQSNVSDAIDDHGMADFVAGAFSDTCITLYRDIKRLPPGHWIRVDARHLRMEPYWALPEAEREARHDQAEEFQHIFEQAVQCRMTGTTSGSLLSGGLDSSSIAMVAQRCLTERQSAPLPSFSMTFHATPKWNEGAFIHAVLNAGQFMPHFLPSDDHDPLSAMATMLTEQEGPFLAYNHSVSRRLYRFARQTGVDTLLDGHGGDEVVSHGFGRLNELAMDRRWLRLWREAGGIAPLFGMSTRKVISPYLDHVRTIRRARASWRATSRWAPNWASSCVPVTSRCCRIRSTTSTGGPRSWHSGTCCTMASVVRRCCWCCHPAISAIAICWRATTPSASRWGRCLRRVWSAAIMDSSASCCSACPRSARRAPASPRPWRGWIRHFDPKYKTKMDQDVLVHNNKHNLPWCEDMILKHKGFGNNISKCTEPMKIVR